MKYSNFLAGIWGVCLVLAACQTTPPTVTPSPLPPTTQLTPAVTASPTSVPIIILSPTNTAPLKSPTPALLVSPTSLTPQAPEGEASQYQLKAWSAERAHELTVLMEEYRIATGANLYYSQTMGQYYGQALYPAIAYQEALLRYPHNSRTHQWQMAALANQALSNPWASDLPYQTYLVESLNEGAVTLDPADLTTWFSAYAPGGEIWVNELVPFAPYLSSTIVSLKNEIGGTSFLVLETEIGFEAASLFNGLGNVGMYGHNTQLVDVTQDGVAELIISYYKSYSRESYIQIYDLSQLPPRPITFGLQPPLIWAQSALQQVESDGQLTFLSNQSSGCFNTLPSVFQWNGEWLELIEFEVSNHERECLSWVKGVSLTPLERQKILTAYETNIGDVPPTWVDDDTGKPYPPDGQDKIRWQLAMGYLALGDVVKTRDYLNRIVQTPAAPESTWIEPAQTFLAEYQTAEDGYQACLTAGDLCRSLLKITLQQLGSQIPLAEYDQTLEKLQSWGVQVVERGKFDLDQDGTAELWFTVQYQPNRNMELWVVATSPTAVKLLLADDFLYQTPVFEPYSSPELPDASFTIEPAVYDYQQVYHLVRQGSTQEPFITTTYIPLPLNTPHKQMREIINQLMASSDPAGVLTQLLALSDPDLQSSQEYQYFLGLTYELLGEEEQAVEAYFKAWQNCCTTIKFNENSETSFRNGFSLMAQAKLEKRPGN